MADINLPVFSEKDLQVLKEGLARLRSMPLSPPGKPSPYIEEGNTPDIYVALTPTGGIPAATIDGDLGTPVLGYDDCYVYRAEETKQRVFELQAVDGLFRRVFNFGAAIPGNIWVLIKKDKWGKWYVESQVSGSPTGTVPTCGNSHLYASASSVMVGDTVVLTLIVKDASDLPVPGVLTGLSATDGASSVATGLTPNAQQVTDGEGKAVWFFKWDLPAVVDIHAHIYSYGGDLGTTTTLDCDVTVGVIISISGTPGSGSGSGSGSGTGSTPVITPCDPVVVYEENTLCEAGILNVYKRPISINIINGCLTKTTGSWALDHTAGCCECGATPVKAWWCVDIDPTPKYWCLQAIDGTRDCQLLDPQGLIDQLNAGLAYISGPYEDSGSCVCDPIVPETGTGSGTGPGELPVAIWNFAGCCTEGSDVPSEYSFTISGTTHFDGTYLLFYSPGDSRWYGSAILPGDLCGWGNQVSLLLACVRHGGTDYMQLSIYSPVSGPGTFATYTVVSTDWNCAGGSSTLVLSYQRTDCDSFPLTLTLTPVGS